MGYHGVEALGLQEAQSLLAQRVGPHGTYYIPPMAPLAGVKSKIGRCSAYLPAFREHVPEHLAQSYNCLLHIFRIVFYVP